MELYNKDQAGLQPPWIGRQAVAGLMPDDPGLLKYLLNQRFTGGDS